ncbi:MAG TPA: hypothetical protein HA257_01280 [Candidatus Methanoperedenaceae archaeon]|nr:hypothetical protein [Candidatus Methanoperedenaceae archaeon]
MEGSADNFIKYTAHTLEPHFGQLSGSLVRIVQIKKRLHAESKRNDYMEFIDQLELNMSGLTDDHNANEICNALRIKVADIFRKTSVPQPTSAPSSAAPAPGADVETELSTKIILFLDRNPRASEEDITDYAKFLALEYGGDLNQTEKFKSYIKKGMGLNLVVEGINKFLAQFPKPSGKDVDDFVRYINLSNPGISEAELRELVERERLIRKFHWAKPGAAREIQAKPGAAPENAAKSTAPVTIGPPVNEAQRIPEETVNEFVESIQDRIRKSRDLLRKTK